MTYTYEAPTTEDLAKLVKPMPAPMYAGSRRTKTHRGNAAKIDFLLAEFDRLTERRNQLPIAEWKVKIATIEQTMASGQNLVDRTHAGYANRDLAATISQALSGLEKYHAAMNAINRLMGTKQNGQFAFKFKFNDEDAVEASTDRETFAAYGTFEQGLVYLEKLNEQEPDGYWTFSLLDPDNTELDAEYVKDLPDLIANHDLRYEPDDSEGQNDADNYSCAEKALVQIVDNGWALSYSGIDIQELENVNFAKSRELDDRIVFEDESTIVYTGGTWRIG